MTTKLAEMELFVGSSLNQQGVIRAALDDPTVINHEHLVGIPDGGQAMRDNKHKVRGTILPPRSWDK